MKNVTATSPTGTSDCAQELQMFLLPELTPGFKLKPSFSREFPLSLGRASPLPAAKAILWISSTNTVKPGKLLLSRPKSPKPSKKKGRSDKSLPGFTINKIR
ncbi:MAG: hypothetical protein LBB26_00720 [Puniceicoccales bacterium]|nr:hypothetical protein [Puniceicoccales bacterium]